MVVCLFNTYYTDDLGTKLLFTKSMILWTKVPLIVAEVRGRLSLLFLFPLLHFASGLSRGKVLLGDAFSFALPKVKKWSPVLSFTWESKAKNGREEEKSGKYSKEKA